LEYIADGWRTALMPLLPGTRLGAYGKELYYFAPDGQLMAVDIQATSTFQYGAPRALFGTDGFASSANFVYRYAPNADGIRFLMT
jgi:hypothetical protein